MAVAPPLFPPPLASKRTVRHRPPVSPAREPAPPATGVRLRSVWKRHQEALPPKPWSLPRQLFPPARMSKRRDVPIRVFMPFLGVRTVGRPAMGQASV